MFEKLLSLLLHAKGGAVATVLVLGASGALVTATVENGMTTVTITQPSTTTTGSETTTGSTTTANNTTVTETILALFKRNETENDPTSTATGNGCSDEAHARNEQTKRVNAASKTNREEVRSLGKDARSDGDAAKKAVDGLVKNADKAIKDIRKAAGKAIHATFDCDKDHDEDEDEDSDDEDEDEGSTTGTTNGTTSTTTTGPSVAFSGDDAKAIADLAISAMELQVTNLKTALDALPAEEAKAEKAKADAKSDSDKGNKNENKGNGKGKGRSGGND